MAQLVSSELSPQSLDPSQTESRKIHTPFGHLNGRSSGQAKLAQLASSERSSQSYDPYASSISPQCSLQIEEPHFSDIVLYNKMPILL